MIPTTNALPIRKPRFESEMPSIFVQSFGNMLSCSSSTGMEPSELTILILDDVSHG